MISCIDGAMWAPIILVAMPFVAAALGITSILIRETVEIWRNF